MNKQLISIICRDMKDIDIRNSLKKSILNKHINDVNSIVVDEFNISLGKVRVDVAVVNGILHAYEIKSEKDNLKRLKNQIQEYNSFFEYITVVTCDRYLTKVLESLPLHCGILKAERKADLIKFVNVRTAKKNKSIKKISLTQVLWKEEMLEILESKDYKKSFKSKSKALLCEMICNLLTEKELLQIVKTKLKSRANWKVAPPQIQNDDYFQLSSKL